MSDEQGDSEGEAAAPTGPPPKRTLTRRAEAGLPHTRLPASPTSDFSDSPEGVTCEDCGEPGYRLCSHCAGMRFERDEDF